MTSRTDTTYKIDTTTKDDYQCCNETLEETYQVQRCFKVEKVVFIGDYSVNKDEDPLCNHLKHPAEPKLANDDDKYYYGTELEDEDADEDARIDCLWELLSDRCGKGSQTINWKQLTQRQELQQMQLLQYRKHSNMRSVFKTSVQTMFEIISKEEDKIKCTEFVVIFI